LFRCSAGLYCIGEHGTFQRTSARIGAITVAACLVIHAGPARSAGAPLCRREGPVLHGLRARVRRRERNQESSISIEVCASLAGNTDQAALFSGTRLCLLAAVSRWGPKGRPYSWRDKLQWRSDGMAVQTLDQQPLGRLSRRVGYSATPCCGA
jgi:hypothetical protein